MQKPAWRKQMKSEKQKNKRIGLRFAWLALIPLSILIRWLFSRSPAIVESIYSQGIYPAIMKPISSLTGMIPLSLWELFIIFMVIFIPVAIIWLIVRCVKSRSFSLVIGFLANVAMIVSIWFFSPQCFGISTMKESRSELSGLDVQPSSVEELYDLCQWLIDNTNRLREQVETDENGIMKVSGGFQSVRDRAQIGYDIAAREYPFTVQIWKTKEGSVFTGYVPHQYHWRL